MNHDAQCTHSCPRCCTTLPNWDDEDGERARYDFMVQVARLVELSRYGEEISGHMNALGTCDVFFNEGFKQNLMDDFSVSEEDVEKMRDGFRRYFAPEPYTAYWWGNPSRNSDENHEARMLAILMYAHMLRENDVEVFSR